MSCSRRSGASRRGNQDDHDESRGTRSVRRHELSSRTTADAGGSRADPGRGVRQLQRMWAAVRRDGADGLVSRKRGRPSTHRFSEKLTRTTVTLLTEYHPDFGPTLASEQLAERHGIRVSNETVRNLMIQSGLWKTRARRKPKIQQARLRRPCFVELIQVDGCDHTWFEDRAPRCTTLAFFEATQLLTHLQSALPCGPCRHSAPPTFRLLPTSPGGRHPDGASRATRASRVNAVCRRPRFQPGGRAAGMRWSQRSAWRRIHPA